MTQYVTDKNGVTLASGNVFSFRKDGNLHSFSSMLVFENLYVDNINSLNCDLQSFSTQLVWYRRRFIFPTLDNFRYEHHEMVLKPWWVKWLNDNTPGWEVPPIVFDRSRENPTIFFQKVSDARKMKKFIAEQLKGAPNVTCALLFSRKS